LSRDDVLVREDVVGPWALEKHQRLRDYLAAYTNIMKSQSWCRGYEYIDAFAGSGSARLRDQNLRIDGSPRIALELPHPFTAYTFIETAPWRIQHLQQLKAEFPDRDIRIVEDDCNRVITREITPRIHECSGRRAFAFLDPFSTHVDYDTIRQIAETGAIEIFLHFPTMAINRSELRNEIEVDVDGAHGTAMDRIWGNHKWHDLLYSRQPDLFGGVWDMKKRRTSADFLSRLFVEERLRSLFKFVTDPIVIKSPNGPHIYCLIFAGHNETGAKIANHVFRKKMEPVIPTPPPATLPLELPF
jgi:three-Cys-motif partner protein